MKKMLITSVLVLFLGSYASAQSVQPATAQTVTKAEEKGYFAKAKKKDRRAARKQKDTPIEDFKIAVPAHDAESTTAHPPKKEGE